MQRGLSYYLTRRFDQGIADFDAVIRIDPGTHVVLPFFPAGKTEKASADLNHAIDPDPNIAPPYYFQGLLYKGRAQYQQAAGEFDRA
jgi:tetratricopeptide (TPR) repeat protein